jgi:hypothetical protein
MKFGPSKGRNTNDSQYSLIRFSSSQTMQHRAASVTWSCAWMQLQSRSCQCLWLSQYQLWLLPVEYPGPVHQGEHCSSALQVYMHDVTTLDA